MLIFLKIDVMGVHIERTARDRATAVVLFNVYV